MAKRQTRLLTPAEAVRQGRKLIAERRRQIAAIKAAMEPEAVAQPEPISGPICQPEAAGQGGDQPAIGTAISEQDQRVEVVSNCQGIPGGSLATAAPSVDARVIPNPDKTGENYSDPIPPASAMPVFPASPEAAKRDTHPTGAWPLADLRSGQCRFACTDDRAPADQHRFCGRPTRISRSNLHGSWCDEHLPRVWGQGSVSERNAHHVTKDVRRFG